jgi:glycosyltransferase involved in cell wall biosynthesis
MIIPTLKDGKASPTATLETLKYRVTVCIPARNEEGNILEVIRKAQKWADEVLVVDGHSKDRTIQIAESLGARVVLDRKKGKGDALRVGAESAEYEIVVFMDADGSHDADDIPALVDPIKRGESDLVIGSRGRGGSDELHGNLEKLTRLLGSDLILIGINWRFKCELTDSQNGFRAIRRDVMLKLGTRENITTIEQEMTMRALKLGYRVGEIPSHEYARRSGESTIHLRKVWFRYIYSFLRNIF